MSEGNRKFDWGSLILGVIFIIVALLSFSNPGSSVMAVVIIFGIAAILKGTFELTVRRRLKPYTGQGSTMLIITGVLDILIGIFMLFNVQFGMIAVAVLFAFWIILDSVFMLITSSYIKEFNRNRFWFTVILGVIGLLIGIVLLFNPLSGVVSIAFIIGIFFMIAGIGHILEAFDS